MRTLLPTRVSHRKHTPASPPDVWAVLGDPRRWPEFDVLLTRVEGMSGDVPRGVVAAGQHLDGVGRGVPRRMLVEVRRVVPRSTLVVTRRVLPGVSVDTEYVLIPATRGGTQLVTVVRTAGPIGRIFLPPLWLAAAASAHRLGRRAQQEQRRRLRATAGAA
jgi:hypothetical protein